MNSIKHGTLLCALLASACVIFSGCIDFGEDVWMNADGTGRMTIDIALPEALMSLGNTDKKDSTDEMHTHFNAMIAKFKKDSSITSASFRDTVIKEMHHMIFDVATKSYNDIPAVHDKFYGDSALSNSGGDSPGKPVLTLSQQGANIHVAFIFPRDTAAKDSSKPADSMGDAIANSMFGNSGFTLRLHAMNIAKSNGTIDTAAHTAEWKLPLMELKHASGKTFEADVVMPVAVVASKNMSSNIPLIVGIVLLVLTAIVVMLIQNRAKAQKNL